MNESPLKNTSEDIDYLPRILDARVYDVAKQTPLVSAPRLSERTQNQVFLKREDEQGVFSFKCRGAYNKMFLLGEQVHARGVVCASAGNHAQGVALAARKLGCRAVIVMPVGTPSLKVSAVDALGAEIVLHGESFSESHAHPLELEEKENLSFVHPFDDPDVIAGQGTVASEILRQHPEEIDAIFVAIGGGGLISGIAAYVKHLRPQTKIIGVQTVDSDAMRQSVAAGRRVVLDRVGGFSDGTAVKQVGVETFRLVQAYVDEILLVGTDEVCAAIKDVFEDTRSILEPAGALSVAGLKSWVDREGARDRKLIAVSCGANINFDRLRFVADCAEAGKSREGLFAVTIPEKRGSFRQFCALLGEHAVTEFNYRIGDRAQAHILVGIGTRDQLDIQRMASLFAQNELSAYNLSEDELTKEHLRHMIGGKSKLAEGERLFRFSFPEQPGALMRFLTAMNPHWNISLFNYRNQGADYGRVLVGLQVPDGEETQLQAFLASIGYDYVEESKREIYGLFI